MLKVLVPIDGSASSARAVKHLVRMQKERPMEVHLLNVQPPLGRYVSRFLDREQVRSYHRDRSGRALENAESALTAEAVPFQTHAQHGDVAATIASFATVQRFDLIVMGTGRKNSLTRFLENSVTNQVMALSTVSVEVVPGGEITVFERVGLPTGIGIGLAIWLLGE